MNTISLESAKAISKKYAATNIDDCVKNCERSVLSDKESCAALLIAFARGRKKHLGEDGFGASIQPITLDDSCFYVKKGNENFLFETIETLISVLGSVEHQDHQNCINACKKGLPGHALIHTSKLSLLSQEGSNQSECLHSYIQLGNLIFDLDLGIRMTKASYDKLFNVKEISTVKAALVKSDICNGAFTKIAKNNVSTAEYLMSRDACVQQFTRGK